VSTVTGYRIRPYAGPADLPAIARVRALIRAHEGEVWLPGPDEPRLPDPTHCLIVESGQAVVGYSWFDWWTEVDGTRLYLLLGWVDPAQRRRGIGQAVLARQESFARRAASLHSGPGSALFGGNADDCQPDTRELLLANGYTVAFTVVRMERELDGELERIALPAGLKLKPVRLDHHPAIHAAIEECFATSRHGHVARTFAEYQSDLVDGADLSLWSVAWDGDQVAGAVIGTIGADGNGRTNWVLVRPPWRRRGLAMALLADCHANMAAAGLSTTRLTTVAENVNRTVSLYEAARYRLVRRQPRYRKPIAAAASAD
jgi:mycothiol synthase